MAHPTRQRFNRAHQIQFMGKSSGTPRSTIPKVPPRKCAHFCVCTAVLAYRITGVVSTIEPMRLDLAKKLGGHCQGKLNLPHHLHFSKP
jgi:hypothetical protein